MTKSPVIEDSFVPILVHAIQYRQQRTTGRMFRHPRFPGRHSIRESCGRIVMAMATAYPLDKLGEADSVYESFVCLPPKRQTASWMEIGHPSRLTTTGLDYM